MPGGADRQQGTGMICRMNKDELSEAVRTGEQMTEGTVGHSKDLSLYWRWEAAG